MGVMQSGWVDIMQVPYNAADTGVIDEVMLLAEKLNLGVVVVSPPENDLNSTSVSCCPTPREVRFERVAVG
ncbi:MAG: hypothetical protein M3305_02040 [Actinomycetota bacterium]|jgi:aryl-alcohol dehydrogenase-like predicted oxidoreductase|nr:hypothetical protein [Actinomycetota bacterium]